MTKRPVPGYPGLFATKAGIIYGSNGKNGLPCKPRIYKQFSDTQGYLYVSYGPISVAVHKLVLLTYVGPCPPLHECCHWDGDNTNNLLSNLRWGTRVENQADSSRIGTRYIANGEANPRAKLTNRLVVEMRKLHDGGERICDIARKYELPYNTTRDIVKRINWSHLP